jgi:hypothetical protein
MTISVCLVLNNRVPIVQGGCAGGIAHLPIGAAFGLNFVFGLLIFAEYTFVRLCWALTVDFVTASTGPRSLDDVFYV